MFVLLSTVLTVLVGMISPTARASIDPTNPPAGWWCRADSFRGSGWLCLSPEGQQVDNVNGWRQLDLRFTVGDIARQDDQGVRFALSARKRVGDRGYYLTRALKLRGSFTPTRSADGGSVVWRSPYHDRQFIFRNTGKRSMRVFRVVSGSNDLCVQLPRSLKPRFPSRAVVFVNDYLANVDCRTVTAGAGVTPSQWEAAAYQQLVSNPALAIAVG